LKTKSLLEAVVHAMERQYIDMYNKVGKCGMMYV